MSLRGFIMRGIAMGLLTCAVGQPALAQRGVPRRPDLLPPPPADLDLTRSYNAADRVRVITDVFAECLFRTDPNAVHAALARLFPDVTHLDDTANSVTMPNCLLGGNLSMPNDIFRGALFRAAYRYDFSRRIAPFGETPYDFSKWVSDPKDGKSETYILLRDFADCVVRAAPDASRQLILARAVSKEESLAMAQLVPALGPCFPDGAQVKFSKEVLISLIAESLYRETQAAVAASLTVAPHG